MLLHRDEDQHCGGLWSFPGGKIEIDEQPETAAKRELYEEAGLAGSDWQQLCQQSFTYPDRILHFTLFTCVCEHLTHLETESAHVWSAISALANYPMPAANDAFIMMLKAKFGD